MCAVPGPTVLSHIEDPQHMPLADARELTKVFLQRLDALEEGVREHQCVRNTLIEMNLTLVHSVVRRSSGRRESAQDMLQVGTAGLIKAIDRYNVPRGAEFTTLAVPYIQGQIKRFARDAPWSVHVPRRLQRGTQPLPDARLPSSPAFAHTCGNHCWPPPDCTAPQLLGADCRLTPYEPAWARGSASDGPP